MYTYKFELLRADRRAMRVMNESWGRTVSFLQQYQPKASEYHAKYLFGSSQTSPMSTPRYPNSHYGKNASNQKSCTVGLLALRTPSR